MIPQTNYTEIRRTSTRVLSHVISAISVRMKFAKKITILLLCPKWIISVLTDTKSKSRLCPGQLQPTYNFRIRSSLGQMYQCRAQHRGALLSLPHKGHRKDVIPKKVFEDYIRDNVDNWFR